MPETDSNAILGMEDRRSGLMAGVDDLQMDPKLRPSFVEIGKTLEEILSRLQEEELERDRKLQPTAKGKR